MDKEQDSFNIFVGRTCKIVLEINNSTYIYTAYVVSYNSEKITFIDKYDKPYSYSTKFITELKLQGDKNG